MSALDYYSAFSGLCCSFDICFFDIIWNTIHVFAGIHPCMYGYARACESLVKASYPLPEEYMKEIALQASIWWQLMVFVKYLSFILKENYLACSTYIWGSYDQMPKM